MDQITDQVQPVSHPVLLWRRAEPGLDPESREWMDGLQSPAAERRAVLARLHGLLLHVARHEAGRRNGWLRLSGPDLDDLARQAAADALTAITVQLDGFRGQSSFRNWACKFVMFGVSAAAGRRFWQTRTISLDQEDWDRLPCSLQPHERAERNELVSALRRAVDEDLSGEQRTVFTAVTLHGVPAAALATALGSNRNAIYKALFEARRILRARLAANRRDLAYLPGSPVTGPSWLDDLLAADPGDAGCDLAFHILDRYAEAELNGTGPQSRFPGVAAHLRRCQACHQDYQGLLAAVEGLRARARLRGDQCVALAAGLLDGFALPRPQTKAGGDRRVDPALAGARGGEPVGPLPDQDPRPRKLITRPFSGWTGRLLLG